MRRLIPTKYTVAARGAVLLAATISLVAMPLTAGAQTSRARLVTGPFTTSTPCGSQVQYSAVVSSPGTLLANCLRNPEQVAVDAAGDQYILATNPSAGGTVVWQVTPAGVRSQFLGATASVVTRYDGSSTYPQAIATDAAGHLYVAYDDGTISEYASDGTTIATSHAVSAYQSASAPGYVASMAVTPSGQVDVVVTNDGSNVSEVVQFSPTLTTTTLLISSLTNYFYGIALAANGSIYVSDQTSKQVDVYAPTGQLVASLGQFLNPEGLAFQANGTLLVADEPGSGLNAVYQISTSGVQSLFSVAYGAPEWLAIGAAGQIYVADEQAFPSEPTGLTGALFLLNSVTSPVSVTATATAKLIVGSYNLTGQLTGNWTGVAGATSYTCTLMYGFNNPSNFTVTTTSTSCTFTGLSPTSAYGVRVVANSSNGSSTPVYAFAAPASTTSTVMHTITCRRGRMGRHVTSFNPVCPTGWYQQH